MAKNRRSRRPPARRQQQPSQPSPQAVAQATVAQVFQQYSGPIPSPEMPQNYENVVPGSAKALMASFQQQSGHRQEIEKKVVDANITAQARGAWLGFIIALAGFALAAYVAYLGYARVAATIAGVDLLGLVSVFVYGKIDQRRERLERFRLMYGGD